MHLASFFGIRHAFLRLFVLSLLLTVIVPQALATQWAPVKGQVISAGTGTPLCAMVLANGQNMFSCSGNGSYQLSVPLDANGKITLFSFASGFAPFRQVLTPQQAVNFTVNMVRETDGRPLKVDQKVTYTLENNRALISGTIDDFGTPVCALVLANGQHMFSCGENQGVFSLSVPLDSEKNITLHAFASGFQPFKVVVSPEDNTILDPVVVATGLITPQGGTVFSKELGIDVVVPPGAFQKPTSVDIVIGRDKNGDVAIEVIPHVDTDAPFTISLPNAGILKGKITATESESLIYDDMLDIEPEETVNGIGCEGAEDNSESMVYCWQSTSMYFVDNWGLIEKYRLPDRGKYTTPTRRFYPMLASQLWSSESTRSPVLSNKEPVLFIHGYTPEVYSLGGGKKTWENFLEFTKQLNNSGTKYIPFEFQWRTSARFQDVAVDLTHAIRRISEKTNQRLHVVAHSMGGNLIRTLLQGLSDISWLKANEHIASVTTIGTPHSGIADKIKTMHGIRLPEGQDNWIFERCGQPSCYQLGENVLTLGFFDRQLLELKSEPGYIAAKLSSTTDLLPQGLPVLSLIGITTDDGKNTTFDTGDALISTNGQRFSPELSIDNSGKEDIKNLLWGYDYGAYVQELVLGFSLFNPKPPKKGDIVSEVSLINSQDFYPHGYRHTSKLALLSTRGTHGEVNINCTDINECEHDTWLKVRQWLSKHQITGRLNDTGITTCSNADTNGLACPVAGYPGQDAEYGRDATHNDDSDGYAGFSFTKLDHNGNPLPPLPSSSVSWSCVKDNVTGLTWEVKTDDGGLHDRDDRYNWYNTDSTSNGGHPGYADDDGNICYGYNSGDSATFCNTQAYVARVNQAGWCGHKDWRIPAIEELYSLVDYSIPSPGPTIDTGYFPKNPSSHVWSSSPDAYSSSNAWAPAFHEGYFLTTNKNDYHSVWLVRGGE